MNRGIGRERWSIPLAGGRWDSVAVALSKALADVRSLMSRRTIQQRLAALRAMGHPTSFAELEANIRLPTGVPNAADVYERALAAFVPPADERRMPLLGCGAELPPRGVPLPEPMVQAIADCLAGNRECLSLLHEAAGIEDCCHRRDLREPLPSAQGLRMCAALLRLNAVFQGHQGDPSAVVLSIRDGLRLADSLRRGPVMFSHLVRIGYYVHALGGLEWTLSAVKFTDRQLHELDDMLATSTRMLDLAEVMGGERSYMIETHNDPPELDSPMFNSPLLKLACVRRIGLIDNLDHMADAIDACKLEGPQRLSRFREMEKEAAGFSFIHVVIKEMVQWTTLLVEVDLRLRARLSLARAALVVERYRLATGKTPGSLDELVPAYLQERPIDPFDGQPIRYQRRENGYLLYSVDTDGQDNGGCARDRDNDEAPCDLPFLVVR